MKVVSKYTIEGCIFIAQHVNQKNNVNSNGWVQLYYYFIFANSFAFSAFSFFVGYYWMAGALFIINIIFLVFLADKIQKESYKTFYKSFFSDDEFKEREIELLEEGISCQSADGDTFFRWNNIKEIVETDGKIFFFTRFNGIPIAKNCFEFGSQIQEFLIFAKAPDSSKIFIMILAFDVHYLNDTATSAGVCFDDWTEAISRQDLVEKTHNVAPYESGKFYKRELPCITSLLQKHNLQPSTIIIDGYVWLDENKIGLGGHLFNELGGKIPIIGVAKSKFKSHSKVKEVLRGNSQTPLYVTAIGVDLDEAAENIKNMHGQFRLPTLLKRADQLCRGIVSL